jgi:GNAT superfamily N-acetyltransferase
MDINKANIDNLTGLWKTMGVRSNVSHAVRELNASTSWPNRYWFDWGTDTGQIATISEMLAGFPQRSITPVWDGPDQCVSLLEQTMIEHRFTVLFEQTAMYLDLVPHSASQWPAGNVARIHTPRDIETWTNIASESFGYDIDISVIHSVADDPDIQLLLAYCEGRAVATAMLYKTADVVGVHQVGVAEKYQGRGIAHSLMRQVIGTCIAWQGKYITLQASVAGEALYKRLGFRPQFSIRNYQRVSHFFQEQSLCK